MAGPPWRSLVPPCRSLPDTLWVCQVSRMFSAVSCFCAASGRRSSDLTGPDLARFFVVRHSSWLVGIVVTRAFERVPARRNRCGSCGGVGLLVLRLGHSCYVFRSLISPYPLLILRSLNLRWEALVRSFPTIPLAHGSVENWCRCC